MALTLVRGVDWRRSATGDSRKHHPTAREISNESYRLGLFNACPHTLSLAHELIVEGRRRANRHQPFFLGFCGRYAAGPSELTAAPFEARHKVTTGCGTMLLRFAICKHEKVDQTFLTPFFLLVELANVRQQVGPR
jgi:hypothetical protein